MTKEEIKEAVGIADTLAGYGIRVSRDGYCQCIFHREKTASMKIYRDSFYCFGCGRGGDVFDIIQKMEGVGFHEAFVMLGGASEKPSRKSMLSRRRSATIRHQKDEAVEQARKEAAKAATMAGGYRAVVRKSPPFSETWCAAVNELEKWDGRAESLLDDYLMMKRNDK